MTIPQLETKRLHLRAFRNEDLDEYAAMCADPEVMRYLGTGVTLSPSDAEVLAGEMELMGGPCYVYEVLRPERAPAS